MSADTFKIAQVATFVCFAWLLVVVCAYWQYQILKPYFKALLWAVVCATAMRKFGPILCGLVDIVEPTSFGMEMSSDEDQEDEPQPSAKISVRVEGWVGRGWRFVVGFWSFLIRPFRAFAAQGLAGPHRSAVFLGMLGRAWLLRFLWWALWRQAVPSAIMGGLVLIILTLWRIVAFLHLRLCSAMGRPTEDIRSCRPTASGVVKLALLHCAAAVVIASVYQVRSEIIFMYRAVESQLPSGSGTWIAEVLERTNSSSLEQVLRKSAGQNAMLDPDFCGALRGQLGLQDEAGVAFNTACNEAQAWLESYINASAQVEVECNTTAEDVCRADGGADQAGPANASHGGPREELPFQAIQRKFEEGLRSVLPKTSKLGQSIRTYVSFSLNELDTEVANWGSSGHSPAARQNRTSWQDLRTAAQDAYWELADLCARLSTLVSVSNIAKRAPEIGRFVMSTSWRVGNQFLFGIYFMATRAFDVLFQFVVFVSATMHLYSADPGLTAHVGQFVAQIGENRGRELVHGLDQAVGGVLGAPLKLAAFHASFTCLLLVCFDSSVICMPTGLAAMLSVIAPSSASAVPVLYGISLWLSGLPKSSGTVLVLSFLAWWYVPDAIYGDIIDGAHPFLTGLSVVMGASCMGPIGCIIGPILIVVPYQVVRSMTADAPAPLRHRAPSRVGDFSLD